MKAKVVATPGYASHEGTSEEGLCGASIEHSAKGMEMGETRQLHVLLEMGLLASTC